MNDVLVICHGSKHRKIQEINYETASFLDIDENAEPDWNLDIGDPDTPDEIGKTFSFIINAMCPMNVIFEGSKNAIQDLSGEVVDGKFDPYFFSNIHSLLQPNGIFYTRPELFFYGTNREPNVRLMEDKIFMFGFKLVEPEKTFIFNDRMMKDFMGFRCVDLPTRDNVWGFIQERIQLEPKIEFFYCETVSTRRLLYRNNPSLY